MFLLFQSMTQIDQLNQVHLKCIHKHTNIVREVNSISSFNELWQIVL